MRDPFSNSDLKLNHEPDSWTGSRGNKASWGSLSHRKWCMTCHVMWVCCFWNGGGVIKRSVSVTWRHTGWLHSSPWWWPLLTWWWTVCWAAALGFVSWPLEDLVRQREEKRDDHTTELKATIFLLLTVCFSRVSLCLTLSFFSRGISFSLRNSAISLSSSRSLNVQAHEQTFE